MGSAGDPPASFGDSPNGTGQWPVGPTLRITHPQSRKLIFVGDLVDRGSKIPQVLELVITFGQRGAALEDGQGGLQRLK